MRISDWISDVCSSDLAHPFYAERDNPLVLADHVSAQDGTGAVHTAPGHGQEDFVAGQKYGLVDKYTAAQLNPVDGRGVYLPSTPPAGDTMLAGTHIWKANDAIVEVLRGNGALLAFAKFEHSYRSEEHTSELQSLMRISYAVFCLK